MKLAIRFFVCLFLVVAVSPACTKTQTKFPEAKPEEVATKFFQLLADGGRLATQEAHKMVSTKYVSMNADSFRKWTENFGSSQSKIKVAEAAIAKERNKNGDWVAMVKLEVSSPSIFDANFTTSSQLNLILDETANEWKIDFNADTIDETAFIKAPQEAKIIENASVSEPATK